MARKQIPRNVSFQMWASCEYEFYDMNNDEVTKVNPITTKIYNNCYK